MSTNLPRKHRVCKEFFVEEWKLVNVQKTQMQSNIDEDQKFEDGEFSSKRVTKGPPCNSNEKSEKINRSYDRGNNNATSGK